MSITTAIVCLGGIAVIAYVMRLLITHRGDFKASGRFGSNEFSVQAKDGKR